MKRQKRYKINGTKMYAFNQYDRMVREHNFIAQSAGNALMKAKMDFAAAQDPEYRVMWEKGFIDIGIDWNTSELVVSPTLEPMKKAQLVNYLLEKDAAESNTGEGA